MGPRTRAIIGHPVPYILVGALVAFIVPGPSVGLSNYIYTCMIVVMFLSTTEIKFKALLDTKRYLSKVVVCLFLNYGLVTGVTLLLAYSAFGSGEVFAGFVIIAAMPTAIVVIPLTYLAKGNTEVALVGVTMTYVMALFMAPVLVLLILGSTVDIWRIIEILLIVIIFPMLASRLLLHLDIDKKFGLAKDIMININMMTVMYIVIGINYEAFFIDPWLLALVAGICFIRTSGTGLGTIGIARAIGLAKENALTFSMFASFKNLGLAAAVSLFLFTERAAIPATIGMPVELFNYILLVLVLGFLFPIGKGRKKGAKGTKK